MQFINQIGKQTIKEIIMRFKTIIFLLIAGIGIMSNGISQDLKIGHANIEAILIYMPETKAMNQELQTYEKKLAEQLQVKQQYLQTIYGEYLELEKTTQDEAVLVPKQEEIRKLDQDVQKASAESQQKLVTRRQDLLTPIVNRLQKEIDALAKAEGYSYILNSIDGSGVSIVLHGPEEHDLTKKLMTRMGITIPDEN